MLAAIEDIDVVVLVHTDAADFLERPAGRKFRPVLHRLVCVCAVANDSHAQTHLCSFAGREACHETKGSANQATAAASNVTHWPRADLLRCPLCGRNRSKADMIRT